MTRYLALSMILANLFGAAGCTHRDRTVIGGPDAQEAAIRMEESEQEYNDCIATREAGGASCDSLKALYEKDRAEYEAQVQ